jgi:hypothetical protein
MLQGLDGQGGSILKDLGNLFSGLSEANRPIRLRLAGSESVFDDVLLVKKASGHENSVAVWNTGCIACRRTPACRSRN